MADEMQRESWTEGYRAQGKAHRRARVCVPRLIDAAQEGLSAEEPTVRVLYGPKVHCPASATDIAELHFPLIEDSIRTEVHFHCGGRRVKLRVGLECHEQLQ